MALLSPLHHTLPVTVSVLSGTGAHRSPAQLFFSLPPPSPPSSTKPCSHPPSTKPCSPLLSCLPLLISCFIESIVHQNVMAKALSIAKRSGGYKEMSSILADQQRPRIWAQGGGGGELRGLSQWVQMYTGGQINFGNLIYVKIRLQ